MELFCEPEAKPMISSLSGCARLSRMREECDAAMRLAAPGVSYGRVGKMLGFAKSTRRKWLKREQCKRPKMSDDAPELDGIWTRVAGGNVELKSARDERCAVLAAVGSWEDALATARDLGASAPSIS